ncbi:nuclear RNA export factor 1 [Episyrphus balteatus]|uniref:nuclear RNA export factor 1 n=1 Tax=Episyrphus balteatus TaxID=286459 RepID=UPI0024855271|nr:nuclear RNA export factor 1 [Episyrphus balteatus]
MPKRGGQRNNYNNNGNRFGGLSSYSDEHDDRAKERSTTRRVSFKPSSLHQNKPGYNRRMAEMAIHSRLEDDDDMNEFMGGSRFDMGRSDRGGRRKGSPIPRGKFGGRKLLANSLGWYQVTINVGQKYNKDDLIRQILTTISPEIFIPLYWRTEKHGVIFFVTDYRIAEILQNADRNIIMYDGFKLPVRVRPGTPQVPIDEAYKEKIKLAMAKRYNPNTRALNLSKFHADEDFKEMFLSLARAPIMSAVIDIIEKNIPELEALNLNDNQMVTMESFKNIAQRLPNLKILYLEENKIPSLAHLLVFRSANITELALKLNPLRNRYKDQSLYISEVRKKFPKLVKLDGRDLEPQILFDVHDTGSLPKPKASFLCDTSGAEIIRQFLEQYFIIFDSDNRQPLLDAYHEQAMLSICLPPVSQCGRLAAFCKLNRNLRRLNNDNDKWRLVKYGRLPVVSTLTEWPKTLHDPQSFTVDLTLFTPKLLSFTVAGLFKEFDVDTGASTSTGTPNNTEIRYFQRQFIIVPAGSGFCIRNELVFLTSATFSQQKRAFKPPAEIAPATNNQPMGLPPLPSAGGLQNRLQVGQPSTPQVAVMAPQIAAGSIIPDEATKLQMIQAMSTQSNMNLEWSRKCLEETKWDFNHAAFVFDKLQKENKIPAEAFIK